VGGFFVVFFSRLGFLCSRFRSWFRGGFFVVLFCRLGFLLYFRVVFWVVCAFAGAAVAVAGAAVVSAANAAADRPIVAATTSANTFFIF